MINITKLHEIGLLLKKSIDDSKLYNEILKVVGEAIEFDFATIFISKMDNQLDPIFSLNEVVVDLASDFNIGNGSGIAGWVVDNDNPIIFPNFMNENPNRKFNSFVSIPLIIDEKKIGVLNLGHSKTNHFDKKDKPNFSIIGGQVAIILDKMNLTKQIEGIKSEYHDVLKSLNEAEDKLKKNEKFASMGEEAASINKEINNPLSVIVGFSDLLINKCKSGNIDPELLNEKLEIILDSARKISTIIHHFKNFHTKN